MLYFIVNEKSRSGKGAEIWQEVKTSLSEKQINYQAWTTEYAGHAFSLAKEITNRDEEDISLVVVGGDGTTNEAINGMEHMEKVRLGVIPTVPAMIWQEDYTSREHLRRISNIFWRAAKKPVRKTGC